MKATREQRECCIKEKDRLVEELKKCDVAETDYERRFCRRMVTRESGEKARSCMIS